MTSVAAPFGLEALWLGGAVYSAIDEPDRYIAHYRRQMELGRDRSQLARACVVIALLSAGRDPEAQSLADGLVEAAERTDNPYAISFALLAFAMANSMKKPLGVVDALRRGLVIAEDSGNTANVSYLAMALAMTSGRVEATRSVSLDNLRLAIGNYFDAGSIAQIRAALGLFMTVARPSRRLRAGGDHRWVRICQSDGRALGSPNSIRRSRICERYLAKKHPSGSPTKVRR